MSLFTLLAGCATTLDSAEQAYKAKDYPTAFKQFTRLASRGDPLAENLLGYMYEYGEGTPQDYAQAMHWYTLSADAGIAHAQWKLGLIYANGLGTPMDYAQALKWYEAAADQGYAPVYRNLGWLYEAGLGVPKDAARAVTWYQRGADAGDVSSETGLGTMYLMGSGVARDYDEAIHWLSIASGKQDSHATEELAYMQYFGLGEEKDEAAAMKLYETAAHQGNLYAATYVGKSYLQGSHGLAEDPVKAQAMFALAADRTEWSMGDLTKDMKSIIDAHKSYPPDAVKAHVEGTVKVEFDLLEDEPLNIKVAGSSGNASLDLAAVRAVADSLFPRRSPYLKKTTHFVIVVSFTITPPPPPAHQQCSQPGACLDG